MAKLHIGVALTALLSTTILTSPALAQAPKQQAAKSETTKAEDTKPLNDGEIIVTAHRRSQLLKDAPISVSAFTSNDLDQRGVVNLDQLQSAIPGIRLVNVGPGSQRIELRGISQYQGLPTVGNYIDEFSTNNQGPQGAPEVDFLDLQRVEVLRGPQPALYGEGSLGGTIRYITADPDLETFGGNVSGEISMPKGGVLGHRASGVLNVPLVTDKAGLRLAVSRNETGGWIDSAVGDDANGINSTTARAKLLLTPSSALRISVMGQYHDVDQAVKSYSYDGYNSAQTNATPSSQSYGLGLLQVEYDFGAATLLSVSGILDQHSRSVDDSTPFYQTLFGGPFVVDVLGTAKGGFTKWSQEFRLTSNGDSRLKYMLGASYTGYDGTNVNYGDGTSLLPFPASVFGLVYQIDASRDSNTKAVFGDISYDINDRFTLNFGGRFFSEDLTVASQTNLIGFPAPGTNTISNTGGSATFNTFNPKVELTFKTGETGIIYVDAARGFRSGGFNGVQDPSVSPTYDPEQLWTYEIGTKQSLLQGKLFFDLSIYYNDYNDIQLNQVVNPTIATVLNGGKASGPGVDLSVQARPVDDLTITASYGWNRLRFDNDSVDKLAGDRPDMVPNWNFSVSADYTPQISANARLISHVDVGATGEAQFTLRSLTAFGFPAITPNEPRTIVNARLGLATGTVETYVFANNLLNEIKVVNPHFAGFFGATYTQPRTIGVGIRAHF